MTHGLSEEQQWDSISKNVLVLSGEHFSFWLLKSFVCDWKVDAVLRETSHQLCKHLLMFSPLVENIPKDADFHRLSLYAVSELIFQFSLLFDKSRPQLSVNLSTDKLPSIEDDDLCSMLTYSRILCKYYSLCNKPKMADNVRNVVTDLFALLCRSRPDDAFCSILRDIWSKFSNSEFGDFAKLKTKRPDRERLAKLLVQLASDIMADKPKAQFPSLLYQMFSHSHNDYVAQKQNYCDKETQHPPDTGMPPVLGNNYVSLRPSISAVEMCSLPSLTSDELMRCHAAFERAGMQLPLRHLRPNEQTAETIRNTFESFSRQQLAVAIPAIDKIIQHPSEAEERQQNLDEPIRNREASIKVINIGRPAVEMSSHILDTSMSPSFSECVLDSPRKSMRKVCSSVANNPNGENSTPQYPNATRCPIPCPADDNCVGKSNVPNISYPLPVSAADIDNIPNLTSDQLSELHAAFDHTGLPLPSNPRPNEMLIAPIRSFFTTHQSDRLAIPFASCDGRSEQLAQATAKSARPRLVKKPDLLESRRRTNSNQNAVAPFKAVHSPLHRTPIADHNAASASDSIIKPSRRSPRKYTALENNPMVRALIRGVASRVNAEKKGGADNGSRSFQKEHSEVTDNLSDRDETEKFTGKPKAMASVSAQPVSSSNCSTPNIPVAPPLRVRIGAPDSDSSESATLDEDSDSEQLSVAKKPRRKKRPWSQEEYKAVQKGVQHFGEGKWREIQLRYPELKQRSNVDIKDAWVRIRRNPKLLPKEK